MLHLQPAGICIAPPGSTLLTECASDSSVYSAQGMLYCVYFVIHYAALHWAHGQATLHCCWRCPCSNPASNNATPVLTVFANSILVNHPLGIAARWRQDTCCCRCWITRVPAQTNSCSVLPIPRSKPAGAFHGAFRLLCVLHCDQQFCTHWAKSTRHSVHV